MQPVEVPFHYVAAQRGNMLGRGDNEPVGVGVSGCEDLLRVERFGGQPDEISEHRHGFVERRLDGAGQRFPRGEPGRGIQTARTRRTWQPSGARERERGGITGRGPGLHGEQEPQVSYGRRENAVGGVVDPVGNRAAGRSSRWSA